MLGGNCIVAVEKTIAPTDVLSPLKVVSSRTRHRITHAKRNTRSPFPNLTLLQGKHLCEEMAVLILHNLLSVCPIRPLSVRAPVAPKERTHIIHLKSRPERDAEPIPEGTVIPTVPGKKMLVQIVVGNRESSRLIHIGRWGREQSRTAVRKLCFCGQGQEGQNQYEG